MTTAAQVIAVAHSQIGITESPAGSNNQKYGAWYHLQGQPWCAIFVSWVFNQAGHPLPNIDTPKGFHYTPTGVNWAKAHGVWSESGHYAPGDIVFYNFDTDPGPEHTGIIVADDGRTLTAIEGNTSVAGSQSNGGEVCVKQRAHGHEVMGVLQMSRLLAAQPPAAKPTLVPPTVRVPMIAADYSGSFPGVAALKAANVSAVLRYVGGDGGKHLSAAEAQACLAAGIDVGGVNETTAQRALSGFSAGFADARNGLADLTAKCGQPARCIGLAVDFDASGTQLSGPIRDYFRGACNAVGVDRVKVYGGVNAVKYILDQKLATYAWQAAAWSGGRVDPRAGLLQTIGGRSIGGTDCDVNTILKPDFGQVYAKPPKPPEEFTLSEAATILAAIAALKVDLSYVKADLAGARKEEADRYVVYTNRDHANVGAAEALATAVDTVPADVWAGQPLPAVAAAVEKLAADQAELRADVIKLLALASGDDVDGSPTEPPVTA
jgi:hypothetical protein